MEPSTDAILNALKAGTYSYSQLKSSRFFKTQIPEERIIYPMVTLIETPTGQSTTQTKTTYTRSFDISIYLALRGTTTTSQAKVITTLETLEREIIEVLENTAILQFNVILNERNWTRDYGHDKPRTHIKSTLTIRTNQVTAPKGIIQDGRLYFLASPSDVKDPPAQDREYMDVYDTDITFGYNEFDEYTTDNNKNPNRYTGGFFGSFVTNVRIDHGDLGTTGEKLNKLQQIRDNGEKQVVWFEYADKVLDSNDIGTGNEIRERFKITIDRVRHIYNAQDNTVFQVSGTLLEPPSFTT